MRLVDDEAAAAELAGFVLDPQREVPIVAVTTRAGRSTPELDIAELAAELGDSAELCVIRTGEATWELAARLPPKLEVFGGAIRLWRPGVTPNSDPCHHPLFLVYGPEDVLRKRAMLLAQLDPASAAGSALEPGAIVEGVIDGVAPYGVFVKIGRRRGLVHVSEMPHVRPAEDYEVGALVRARVLPRDDGELALTFREDRGDGSSELTALREENLQLKEEVRGMAAERRELLLERARLRERLRQLERRPRGRGGTVRAGTEELDEPGFRALMDEVYAERYTEDDRRRYPLREVRLGVEFLKRVRQLEGVDLSKIVEVSVDVAARRAHEIPAREAHVLKEGEGGAPQRVRLSDGARAWRCALQVGTPSARGCTGGSFREMGLSSRVSACTTT